MQNKHEGGFVRTLVMIAIAVVAGFFIYYAYKNFVANPKVVDQEAAKGLFNKTLEDTKSGLTGAKDKAVEDAKNKAVDEIKNSL